MSRNIGEKQVVRSAGVVCVVCGVAPTEIEREKREERENQPNTTTAHVTSPLSAGQCTVEFVERGSVKRNISRLSLAFQPESIECAAYATLLSS
jgi:hypothetical protein